MSANPQARVRVRSFFRRSPIEAPGARWRSFANDRRGVTAIEFGLLALPFFSLLCGLFEIAFVNFTSEGMQAAVTNASRQLLIGQVQSQNITTAAQFRDQLLCPSTGKRLMPSNVDCSKLIIDVRTAVNFASAQTNNTFYLSPTVFCPGAAGSISVVRVVYPLPTIFPLSFYSPFVGLANNVPNTSGWVHVLMGSAVFQVEPFQTGYTPPC